MSSLIPNWHRFLAVVVLLSGNLLRADPFDVPVPVRTYLAEVRQAEADIPGVRRAELEKAARWIRSRLDAGETVQLTFICTHNSRRSHLAQAWAQAAAEYFGGRGIHTHSGGTEATACNPRTIAALRRAGFQIPDPPVAANPVFEIRFSEAQPPLKAFSKVYDHDGNPTSDYLALMCCSHADENCPIVRGASSRISLNYEDPKASDGSPDETATYDARCREIARDMVFMMSRARR